ncbi:MAG TPA: TolC family protein [Verrucomicrobiae bacterium]
MALSALLISNKQGIASENTNTIPLTSTYITTLAEQMRTNHPALQAAGKRIESTQANAASVRSWSDPTFTAGGMAASKSMRADDGDFFYGVEQKLPVFGKEKQERKAASASIAVGELEQEAAFQVLRRDLAKTLFDTAYASRAVRVAQEDIEWLKSLEQSVEAQYGFGNATQADVLRVQNELAKRREDLKTTQQTLDHAIFTLNRFLNLPLTNAGPHLTLPELAKPIVYNERLARLAVKHEPQLRVMRQQLGVADEEIALAKMRRRPDLGVGLQGRNYTGTGEFRSGEIMVSLSLPWFNRERYRQDVIREEKKKEALEKEVNDKELGVRQEIHELVLRIDAAHREALLYQDNIIPRTKQMIESMYATWQTSAGPLRDLLDARRMLLDAELSRAKAITAQYQAMAELILCCGLGDFESLEMLGTNVLPDSSRQSERPRNATEPSN